MSEQNQCFTENQTQGSVFFNVDFIYRLQTTTAHARMILISNRMGHQ